MIYLFVPHLLYIYCVPDTMTVIGLHVHFRAYLKFCEVYLPKFQEIVYGEQIKARASGSITFCLDLYCSTYHNFACWNESSAWSGFDHPHVLSIWHKTWNLIETQQGRFGWIKAPHKHTLFFLKTCLFLLDIKTVLHSEISSSRKKQNLVVKSLVSEKSFRTWQNIDLKHFDLTLIWRTKIPS